MFTGSSRTRFELSVRGARRVFRGFARVQVVLYVPSGGFEGGGNGWIPLDARSRWPAVKYYVRTVV